jgi:hypothetical protein
MTANAQWQCRVTAAPGDEVRARDRVADARAVRPVLHEPRVDRRQAGERGVECTARIWKAGGSALAHAACFASYTFRFRIRFPDVSEDSIFGCSFTSTLQKRLEGITPKSPRIFIMVKNPHFSHRFSQFSHVQTD